MIIPVHELYPNNDAVETNFDILFFHGLQIYRGDDAWRTTWLGGSERSECWPAEWLPQDLNESVRILSASYDSEATKWFGRGNTDDVTDIGENLSQVMKMEKIGSRKFVLVGHSFGGLVIKSLLTEMHRLSHLRVRNATDKSLRESAEEFLKNLQGIVFYAVPHSGSDAASLVKYLKFLGLSKIITNLQPLENKMAKLSVTAEDAFHSDEVIVYAFCEGKKTSFKGMFPTIVVPQASARQLARNNMYVLEDCDHSEVCKPRGRGDVGYRKLVEVLRLCGAGPAEAGPTGGRDAGTGDRELLARVHGGRVHSQSSSSGH